MTSYVPPGQQQAPRFSQPQQFPGHPQARPGPLPGMPLPQQRPTLSQYPSMSGPGMPMQQLQQLQAPRPAQQMQAMPTGVPAGMYGAPGQQMPRPQVPHRFAKDAKKLVFSLCKPACGVMKTGC